MTKSFVRSVSLDPEYGESGIAYPDQRLYDIRKTIETDQGQVGVGLWETSGNNSQYVIFRLNDKGELDKRFANEGVYTGTIDGHAFSAGADVVQLPDGGFFMFGYWREFLTEHFYLSRFDANGFLDETFGERGHLAVDPPIRAEDAASKMPPREAVGEPMTARPWGFHLAPSSSGAYLTFNLTTGTGVIKYKADGTYDSDFGNNGVITLSRNILEIHYPYSIRADIRGISLGVTSFQEGSEGPPRAGVIRVTHSGEFDERFGESGYSFFDKESTLNDHCVLPDGRIIIAAQKIIDSVAYLTNLALTADGKPDPDYEQTFYNLHRVFDARVEHLKDSNETLVIAKNHTTQIDLYAARFKANGEIHSDGWSELIPPSMSSLGTMSRQSNGKITIDGNMYLPGNIFKAFSLRLLAPDAQEHK